MPNVSCSGSATGTGSVGGTEPQNIQGKATGTGTAALHNVYVRVSGSANGKAKATGDTGYLATGLYSQ